MSQWKVIAYLASERNSSTPYFSRYLSSWQTMLPLGWYIIALSSAVSPFHSIERSAPLSTIDSNFLAESTPNWSMKTGLTVFILTVGTCTLVYKHLYWLLWQCWDSGSQGRGWVIKITVILQEEFYNFRDALRAFHIKGWIQPQTVGLAARLHCQKMC